MASKLENLEALSKAEFLYLDKKNFAPLVKEGTAEINEAFQQDGKTATRITQKGIDFLNSFNDPSTSGTSATLPNHTIPEVKNMNATAFTIETLPIPATKRKGGAGRPSKYPFDALEVGQMFFIPATEKQPDPAKTLGSVVTAANRRFATETGETKTNRKGETVAKLNYTRKFVLRPFNKEIDGLLVPGAGIWREK